MAELRRETLCIHGGWTPSEGEPRALPIYQSTTFKYDSSEKMSKLFNLEEAGYFYSRLQNPTNDLVAKKICELEGGAGAMLTSSGQAANFYAVFNICTNGGHFIMSSHVYGGTHNLLTVSMAKMGVEYTIVDPDASEEELSNAFRPNTKCVVAETLSNPSLTVLDIEKFAKVAHDNGVPLIIDNTFATPINCRPIEWGADIVVHSTTKYLDGHGVSVGGVIVDSGKFNWNKYPKKYACLCEPDESYHGIIYSQQFGTVAYLYKAVAQLMRDFGSSQSPQNAFYVNVGLETLHLRMERHCYNGLAVAKYLNNHPSIEWVNYPNLEGNKYYELASKYLPNGSCGVVSFGIKGGREGAKTFMNKLRLISIATHVADAKTCILHPAETTHRQLTDEQLAKAGVSPDLVRLSVGIEHIDDIINDLKYALE